MNAETNINGNAGRLLARPTAANPSSNRSQAPVDMERKRHRLKLWLLNRLTLGFGENLRYGDIPYQDLNFPLLARCARLVGINLNNLKVPTASGGSCG